MISRSTRKEGIECPNGRRFDKNGLGGDRGAAYEGPGPATLQRGRPRGLQSRVILAGAGR